MVRAVSPQGVRIPFEGDEVAENFVVGQMERGLEADLYQSDRLTYDPQTYLHRDLRVCSGVLGLCYLISYSV
jgi:hypothetical protein